MKKISSIFMVAFTLFVSPLAHSLISGSTYFEFQEPDNMTTYSQTYLNGKLRYLIYDNKWQGFVSDVPHCPQPNEYTCGAANLAMVSAWMHYITTSRESWKPDISKMYNAINKDGVRGISTNELKNYLNKMTKDWDMTYEEVGYSTVNAALFDYVRMAKHLIRDGASMPAIVYGNVKNGSAGGHYYSIVGGIHCTSSCDLVGAYMHDSVHGSPYYLQAEPKIEDYDSFVQWTSDYVQWFAGVGPGIKAIMPGRFMAAAELERYWSKTGSAYPWKRKHFLIIFDD